MLTSSFFYDEFYKILILLGNCCLVAAYSIWTALYWCFLYAGKMYASCNINNFNNFVHFSKHTVKRAGLLVPKFAGSRPAEAVGFFRGKKILSTPSFGGEVKPSVPFLSFTACKRSLNVTWKSTLRQTFRTFLAHSSTFCHWVLSCGDTRGDAWWRKLESLTQIAQ